VHLFRETGVGSVATEPHQELLVQILTIKRRKKSFHRPQLSLKFGFSPHPENRVSHVPKLFKPSIFGPTLVSTVVLYAMAVGPTCQEWAPQLFYSPPRSSSPPPVLSGQRLHRQLLYGSTLPPAASSPPPPRRRLLSSSPISTYSFRPSSIPASVVALPLRGANPELGHRQQGRGGAASGGLLCMDSWMEPPPEQGASRSRWRQSRRTPASGGAHEASDPSRGGRLRSSNCAEWASAWSPTPLQWRTPTSPPMTWPRQTRPRHAVGGGSGGGCVRTDHS
jgi:hypothetical protein